MINCILASLGSTEFIIIACIVVLLFGGKKIPELMRGVGKGVRSFKDGMADVQNELEKDERKNDDRDAAAKR